MKRILIFIGLLVLAKGLLLLLSGCGVEAPPQPPATGVTIGGEARIGIVSGGAERGP